MDKTGATRSFSVWTTWSSFIPACVTMVLPATTQCVQTPVASCKRSQAKVATDPPTPPRTEVVAGHDVHGGSPKIPGCWPWPRANCDSSGRRKLGLTVPVVRNTFDSAARITSCRMGQARQTRVSTGTASLRSRCDGAEGQGRVSPRSDERPKTSSRPLCSFE